ncbi:hypothetical protein BFV96_0546 [Alteromonas macleodii]|nr:hypothetical protein BFV96_0546 [Alteromonas macleodii]
MVLHQGDTTKRTYILKARNEKEQLRAALCIYNDGFCWLYTKSRLI